MIVAFERPAIDWHAVAPEIVLLSVGVLITLLDILFLEKARPYMACLLYTSPSPRDKRQSRMPSSA